MRSFATTKRIVIGAIALAVIGVAAYVLSRPTKGTVEWHEREYRRLQEGNKLVGFIRWITGLDDIFIRSEAEETELAAHESALLQSGHLGVSISVLVWFVSIFWSISNPCPKSSSPIHYRA